MESSQEATNYELSQHFIIEFSTSFVIEVYFLLILNLIIQLEIARLNEIGVPNF